MISRILMSVLFFAVWGGLSYYLAWHLQTLFATKRRWLWTVGFFVGLAVLIVGMIFSLRSHHLGGTILYRVVGLLLLLVIYLLMGLVVFDLVGLACRISQKVRFLLALGVSVCFVGYGVWNSFYAQVVEDVIYLPGLTKSVKALHLTDTHFGHARGFAEMQKLIRLIQDVNPDVVFFTGDMFDSGIEIDSGIFGLFSQLTMPLYFVEGNHDIDVGTKIIKDAMREQGVIVVENETLSFGEIDIVGLDHMPADKNDTRRYGVETADTMKNIISRMQINKDRPTIALNHTPSGMQYLADAGVDLTLAGHTHAGQFFPMTLLVGMIYEFNRGLYNLDDMQIYVCAGTGTFGPIARIGTRSELCVLNLQPIRE